MGILLSVSLREKMMFFAISFIQKMPLDDYKKAKDLKQRVRII